MAASALSRENRSPPTESFDRAFMWGISSAVKTMGNVRSPAEIYTIDTRRYFESVRRSDPASFDPLVVLGASKTGRSGSARPTGPISVPDERTALFLAVRDHVNAVATKGAFSAAFLRELRDAEEASGGVVGGHAPFERASVAFDFKIVVEVWSFVTGMHAAPPDGGDDGYLTEIASLRSKTLVLTPFSAHYAHLLVARVVAVSRLEGSDVELEMGVLRESVRRPYRPASNPVFLTPSDDVQLRSWVEECAGSVEVSGGARHRWVSSYRLSGQSDAALDAWSHLSEMVFAESAPDESSLVGMQWGVVGCPESMECGGFDPSAVFLPDPPSFVVGMHKNAVFVFTDTETLVPVPSASCLTPESSELYFAMSRTSSFVERRDNRLEVLEGRAARWMIPLEAWYTLAPHVGGLYRDNSIPFHVEAQQALDGRRMREEDVWTGVARGGCSEDASALRRVCDALGVSSPSRPRVPGGGAVVDGLGDVRLNFDTPSVFGPFPQLEAADVFAAALDRAARARALPSLGGRVNVEGQWDPGHDEVVLPKGFALARRSTGVGPDDRGGMFVTRGNVRMSRAHAETRPNLYIGKKGTPSSDPGKSTQIYGRRVGQYSDGSHKGVDIVFSGSGETMPRIQVTVMRRATGVDVATFAACLGVEGGFAEAVVPSADKSDSARRVREFMQVASRAIVGTTSGGYARQVMSGSHLVLNFESPGLGSLRHSALVELSLRERSTLASHVSAVVPGSDTALREANALQAEIAAATRTEEACKRSTRWLYGLWVSVVRDFTKGARAPVDACSCESPEHVMRGDIVRGVARLARLVRVAIEVHLGITEPTNFYEKYQRVNKHFGICLLESASKAIRDHIQSEVKNGARASSGAWGGAGRIRRTKQSFGSRVVSRIQVACARTHWGKALRSKLGDVVTTGVSGAFESGVTEVTLPVVDGNPWEAHDSCYIQRVSMSGGSSASRRPRELNPADQLTNCIQSKEGDMAGMTSVKTAVTYTTPGRLHGAIVVFVRVLATLRVEFAGWPFPRGGAVVPLFSGGGQCGAHFVGDFVDVMAEDMHVARVRRHPVVLSRLQELMDAMRMCAYSIRSDDRWARTRRLLRCDLWSSSGMRAGSGVGGWVDPSVGEHSVSYHACIVPGFGDAVGALNPPGSDQVPWDHPLDVEALACMSRDFLFRRDTLTDPYRRDGHLALMHATAVVSEGEDVVYFSTEAGREVFLSGKTVVRAVVATPHEDALQLRTGPGIAVGPRVLHGFGEFPACLDPASSGVAWDHFDAHGRPDWDDEDDDVDVVDARRRVVVGLLRAMARRGMAVASDAADVFGPFGKLDAYSVLGGYRVARCAADVLVRALHARGVWAYVDAEAGEVVFPDRCAVTGFVDTSATLDAVAVCVGACARTEAEKDAIERRDLGLEHARNVVSGVCDSGVYHRRCVEWGVTVESAMEEVVSAPVGSGYAYEDGGAVLLDLPLSMQRGVPRGSDRSMALRAMEEMCAFRQEEEAERRSAFRLGTWLQVQHLVAAGCVTFCTLLDTRTCTVAETPESLYAPSFGGVRPRASGVVESAITHVMLRPSLHRSAVLAEAPFGTAMPVTRQNLRTKHVKQAVTQGGMVGMRRSHISYRSSLNMFPVATSDAARAVGLYSTAVGFVGMAVSCGNVGETDEDPIKVSSEFATHPLNVITKTESVKVPIGMFETERTGLGRAEVLTLPFARVPGLATRLLDKVIRSGRAADASEVEPPPLTHHTVSAAYLREFERTLSAFLDETTLTGPLIDRVRAAHWQFRDGSEALPCDPHFYRLGMGERVVYGQPIALLFKLVGGTSPSAYVCPVVASVKRQGVITDVWVDSTLLRGKGPAAMRSMRSMGGLEEGEDDGVAPAKHNRKVLVLSVSNDYAQGEGAKISTGHGQKSMATSTMGVVGGIIGGGNARPMRIVDISAYGRRMTAGEPHTGFVGLTHVLAPFYTRVSCRVGVDGAFTVKSMAEREAGDVALRPVMLGTPGHYARLRRGKGTLTTACANSDELWFDHGMCDAVADGRVPGFVDRRSGRAIGRCSVMIGPHYCLPHHAAWKAGSTHYGLTERDPQTGCPGRGDHPGRQFGEGTSAAVVGARARYTMEELVGVSGGKVAVPLCVTCGRWGDIRFKKEGKRGDLVATGKKDALGVNRVDVAMGGDETCDRVIDMIRAGEATPHCWACARAGHTGTSKNFRVVTMRRSVRVLNDLFRSAGMQVRFGSIPVGRGALVRDSAEHGEDATDEALERRVAAAVGSSWTHLEEKSGVMGEDYIGAR